jgi:hypothetical protein
MGVTLESNAEADGIQHALAKRGAMPGREEGFGNAQFLK